MPPVIAIIAQGAMGSGVARRLTEKGAIVLTSLSGRSEASAKRAAAAGMRAVPMAELAGADVILFILPPAEAPALAERLAPHLAGAEQKPVFADCNAIGPETARRIAGIITPTGCAFVDGGIIGGPPQSDGSSPVLYLSGPEAGRLAMLGEYGLDVRIIEGPVGAASALKLSYAGITKGLTALASAMMLAATRANAAEGLHGELERSQPQLLAWLNRMVPPMYDKAYRWVGEMEEIAGFVQPDEAAHDIYRAVARFYRQIAADVEGPKQATAALSAFLATPGKN